MDEIKMEHEIDPLAIERYNKADTAEGNALSQERNFSYQHVTGIKEEYEDQSQDLTSEEDPVPKSLLVVKHEPEERNFLTHHVTGIKEEYVNQSPDLISEIKFEEDPVPISFPVVKREPEEEQSDFHQPNEESWVEVTAEDEIFIESYE
ncbi:chromo domain-containing protein cec-1-like isoform X2 [Periplaneta americana]|uniref:chromo domain-containing protein cec-1-like isoform X2 n=1 Tax=Periplaneta americana TaxID=6978 RepID=UPI0037E74490